jgi:hypothetical protein
MTSYPKTLTADEDSCYEDITFLLRMTQILYTYQKSYSGLVALQEHRKYLFILYVNRI